MSPPPDASAPAREPREPRELVFSAAEMDAFAAASGDHSPLHTEAEFGRRTAFGAPIVYGALETIALLGLLAAEDQARVSSVRSVFSGPVLIGERCHIRMAARPGRFELSLSARGRVLARVSARTDAARTDASRAPAPASPAQIAADDRLPVDGDGAPRPGFAARSPYTPGDELYALAARLGAGAVPRAVLDGIAWASRTVGAGIPGFHGLCAGVQVTDACERPAGATASQWLHVAEYDERSDRVLIDGGVCDAAGAVIATGRIECFPFGPTPVPAPALGRAPALGGAPAGVAVVIGASRGAGAALALALLARGYEVHGVYAACEQAAAHLRGLAGPRAAALHLHRADAADIAALTAVAGAIEAPLDGLVLCAAPAALPMTLTPQTAEAVNEHVRASLALAAVPVAVFGPRLRREGAWVIGLSAAAVTEPERDYPQLTAAKSAVEGLLRAVAPTLPGRAILIARPPAMRTDRANTPGARRRALAPETVAGELVARVSDATLAPGVTVVEPGREGGPTTSSSAS